MRITYSKRMTGEGDLKPFLKKLYQNKLENAWVHGHEHIDVRGWDYDLQALQRYLMNEMGQAFTRNEMQYKASKASFWVKVPLEFALTLDAELPQPDSDQNKIFNEATWILKNSCEKIWEREPEKDENAKEKIPIYQEIPCVDISGEIAYKDLLDPDPTQVLSILEELGYGWTVIPTSKDAVPLLEKLLAELKK
ncbi:MAG: hypothetical protein KJ709_09610 [Nanoarchaeota archaeon]|nr:hypothetical protein [Nanoarchaeota archaeon]